MRRIGLYGAGLLIAFLLSLTLATTSRAKAPISHTCSVVDRQFIDTAGMNMTALSLWGQQYLNGDAQADDLVAEAKRAAQIVGGTSPTDPSLAQTRKLMVAMFGEYAKGIRAHARRHGNAGEHMGRAYGLANSAHDVLASAEPGLRRMGCDVQPLL